jgi:hypothetical protein
MSHIGTIQTRLWNVIGLTMILVLGLLNVSCNSPPMPSTYDILFSESGKEYEIPGTKLWYRLVNGSDADRRALLDRLLTILEQPGGYSRLVAARALLDFFAEEGKEYLTERAAMVIAKQLIRVAEEHIGHYVAAESLEFPSGPLYKMIWPQYALYVDGEDVLLQDRLPEGWIAEDGSVIVDGADAWSIGGGYAGRKPVECVDLKRLLGDDLLGEHKIVSHLTVIAPNGLRIPLKREVSIEVVPMEWFQRGPL